MGLLVYVDTNVRTRALQEALQQAIPGVAVTVFGRVRDLQQTAQSGQRIAVMARRPLLASMGLKPGLQGIRDGSETERCVLLSTETISHERLTQIGIGVVDQLGRQQMPAYVAQLLRLRSEPRLERVVKQADLIGLLRLHTADAVLLPENDAKSVMQESRLPLKLESPDGCQLFLPAIAFSDKQTEQQLAPRLRSMARAVNERLGVDTWR